MHTMPFGTLTAISFMTLGKLFNNKKEINNDEIISALKEVIIVISKRGKSNIGDKTILDSLNEIIKYSKNNNEKDIGFITNTACHNALNIFKGKECKIGRARMFAEKSKDLDDPGMFALAILSDIFIN